eukprot:3070228-Prymnesium_polylepis.1
MLDYRAGRLHAMARAPFPGMTESTFPYVDKSTRGDMKYYENSVVTPRTKGWIYRTRSAPRGSEKKRNTDTEKSHESQSRTTRRQSSAE